MRKLSRKLKVLLVIVLGLLVAAIFMVYQWWPRGPQPGTVLDEARLANRPPSSFIAAEEDYFHDMDQQKNGVIPLTVDEVKGRNTWLVWTGGNDRLWDKLTLASFGALDLLKTLSSYPKPVSKTPNDRMKFGRDNRWAYLGLVNEPCFEKPSGPDPDRFGLYLDKRKSDCPPDPFENESKYPGVKVGSRGQDLPAGTPNQYLPKNKKMPIGSYYGYASGIVGLRLFPNPDFDAKAAANWDPERYYNDPDYYQQKDLVRPYRVGMSCAFCHVGPNPIKPPANPEHPQWENLSSNVGAQYFWIDRIFDWSANPANYIFQMFHSSRPGTLDTSLVSTDNINNPRTMNAIYELGPRLDQAKRFGKETLGGGSANNKQFNDYVPPGSPLAQFFTPPATVLSPRVLKDAADSVGALGALNRVYLNIGLFSEEWLLHFRPLIGGKKVTPIEIAVARKNSGYWEATEAQTPDMALFFLKTTAAHKLKDAPGGDTYLTKDMAQLDRGKIVFAENCARCHSTKLPQPDQPKKIFTANGCAGPEYLQCWGEYWAWTKTDEFKSKMRAIVSAPDFLDRNYLSAEFRVPVTLLQTNACSPLATNAIRDNIWDNFSSETYKNLPSVGTIKVYNPVNGEEQDYAMPGGGRGYTRPASLISLWSTAPFLLNNTVGRLNPTAPSDDYNPSPSVEKRMAAFNDGIEKMLWPEKRERDSVVGDKVHGLIDRTTETSYVSVGAGYLPESIQGLGPWLFPRLFGEGGGLQLGPIPRGTPVGLLANLLIRPEEMNFWERWQRDRRLKELIFDLQARLARLGPKRPNESDADYDKRAQAELTPLVPALMSFSKCPDYVVNRGHYFGTGYDNEAQLSNEQKKDLIEFLKTF